MNVVGKLESLSIVTGDGGGGQKACTESERMTGLVFAIESCGCSIVDDGDEDFVFQSIKADWTTFFCRIFAFECELVELDGVSSSAWIGIWLDCWKSLSCIWDSHDG